MLNPWSSSSLHTGPSPAGRQIDERLRALAESAHTANDPAKWETGDQSKVDLRNTAEQMSAAVRSEQPAQPARRATSSQSSVSTDPPAAPFKSPANPCSSGPPRGPAYTTYTTRTSARPALKSTGRMCERRKCQLKSNSTQVSQIARSTSNAISTANYSHTAEGNLLCT